MSEFIRSAGNYDMAAASLESGVDCSGYLVEETGEWIETPSLAKQAFKEECDINVIVYRFGLAGKMPQNVRAPTYGDFTNVPTYQEALNALVQAQRSFEAMPARVRARFENDPGQFVDFCSDPANLAELRQMGLAVPEQPQAAQPAPVRVEDQPPPGGGS